jgi:hypothetical protein
MTRFRWLVVPLILAAFAPFTPAKRIAAPPNPVQRALLADTVVVGKVTSIEKEPVEVEEGGQKTAFKIGVVKIESALLGAANTTHIKVGVPAGRPGRGLTATLEENQEGVFFLTKHPSGQFHTFNWRTGPVPTNDENYKAVVANVKKALAVVADPVKALKAEKAEDRSFAAVAVIFKNRSQVGDVEMKNEKMSAEESKLILQSLAEANWAKADPTLPAPLQAMYLLALTPEDGWNPPKAEPGKDFNEVMQAAFVKWLDGPGKDYRINKLVPKK